jgi:two-component system sensor histidine kinase ComP
MHIAVKCGRMDDDRLSGLLEYYDRSSPLCELVESAEGYMIKIGEARGQDFVLIIGDAHQLLQPEKVWLKTLTRHVNVLYDNFRVIGDLTDELERMAAKQSAPDWLLRLMFNMTENERKRLSQDLHDSVLQQQIIWYREAGNHHQIIALLHDFPTLK